MKNKLTTKLFCILLITVTFLTLFFTSNVQATSLNEADAKLNEIMNTEDKIMKYDVRSDETTEVDIQELRQIISRKNYSTNISHTEGYIPSKYIQSSLPKKETTAFFSSDSAQRITNTSVYPYIQTCRIKAYDGSVDEGHAIYGTASIVGPKAALTCAHCVFNDKKSNTKYLNWTIYPGYNNGTYYGTACGWDTVYYSNTWMETHDYEYDWAICVLQSDVGNQIGWCRSSILWH
ncbi:MAG: hypothetical protein HFJ41_02615 [Clostridia bacterium]|nr:hypothetical protein [Clostridia bacterium]